MRPGHRDWPGPWSGPRMRVWGLTLWTSSSLAAHPPCTPSQWTWPSASSWWRPPAPGGWPRCHPRHARSWAGSWRRPPWWWRWCRTWGSPWPRHSCRPGRWAAPTCGKTGGLKNIERTSVACWIIMIKDGLCFLPKLCQSDNEICIFDECHLAAPSQ